MSDPMIKLTNEQGKAFYVNAFSVDLVEPPPSLLNRDERARILVGEAWRSCCEDPDTIAQLIWGVRNEVAERDA